MQLKPSLLFIIEPKLTITNQLQNTTFDNTDITLEFHKDLELKTILFSENEPSLEKKK